MGIFTQHGEYIVRIVPSDAAVSPSPHCAVCVETVPHEFPVVICYRECILVSARGTVHPAGLAVEEPEGLSVFFYVHG